MNIGTILAGLGILVVVVAYVARPVFGYPSNRQEPSTLLGSRVQLTARRDAVYALIRELDADYATGKVNDQDYRALRERYVAEGVSILKQLDALPDEQDRAALEVEIEEKVRALRKAPPPTRADPDDQPALRYCTQCGQPADPSDLFCAQCGASLKGTASQ